MRQTSGRTPSRLDPYVPELLSRWEPSPADPRHMRVSGSLAFVDVSGFTRLTERLARKGKVGAEEMSDVLNSTFAALLEEARSEGGDLVKWGGDAVLLLFRGPEHAVRAARAAHQMRATMRRVGRVRTSSGTVRLRMSAGVHSGEFDFFLVGDPGLHHELLVSGPGASVTAEVEAAAAAGQIGLSAAAASLLPPATVGAPLAEGNLLRRSPPRVGSGELAMEASTVPYLPPEAALPGPIREHLLMGAAEPEHRTVTVAFVQFSGTDDLLRQEGPGAVCEALDEMVRNVQSACAEHDVTFFETDINRDGGKVMLTAGAPRSTDHLEERMLRVARQVLDRAGRLPLRVGINRGHVFAGDFGPPFRRTYSVKGDAINLAARVMGKAAPGQVLATLEVLSRSQSAFQVEELPPFLVKGKAHPVHAAVVESLLGPRLDTSLDVGLVGRDAELTMLVDALEEARAGRGRAVEVLGEPGIGKTRLVAEMLGTVDARAVSARCEPYESSTAYFPFRKLLRDALGLRADADSAEAELRQRVAAVAPALQPWAPLLGIPLDLPVAETPETADLDPEFRAAHLQSVVVEVLGAALPEHTVILVEDIHYIDDASAELLARLTAVASARSWLLVTTRRDQHSGLPEGSGDRRTTLRLDPLDERSSLEIVRRALREHPVPPQAMEALARRSGGNPLFLEALVRQVGRSGAGSELPDRIETLLASEVDRLSPDERRVLRYAAVLGSVVDEQSLGLLLADQGGLDPSVLERLEEFLVRGSSGRLRFRSAIMRDVAYEGLPYRRRRALHQQVGETIEKATATPDRSCEALSLHFFHAGDEAKAWRYSVLAGKRAAAKHAHAEAVDFYERAVRSVPRDGSVDAVEVAAAFEDLADSRFLLGLTEGAGQAYAAAGRLLRTDPVRHAFLVEKEARVDLRRRRFAQAMRRLSRGLHALEGHHGERSDVARSLLARRYAYCRFSQGRIDEALRWAAEATRFAEESVDKEALAQAYEMLNAIYVGAGRAEPLPYGQLALQANRELGDLAPQGHCLNNLAVAAFTHGRWEEALVSYRQAAEIFHRIGDAASEGNAAYNQAELLVRQGRFAEARELLDEVLLIARAVDDDELVALALRELAHASAGTGALEEALHLLDQARRLFEELQLPDEVATTEVSRAEALLRAGRPDDAGEVLAAAAAAYPDLGDVGSPRWHRLRASASAARGHTAQARAELAAGLEKADPEEDRVEHALLVLHLAGVLEQSGEPVDASGIAQARATLEAMGVVTAR